MQRRSKAMDATGKRLDVEMAKFLSWKDRPA